MQPLHIRFGVWAKRRRRWLLGGYLLFLCLFAFCLPRKLFTDPVSTVVVARDSTLLGARIATDGQWRFPHNPEPPEKFVHCLLTFEDKRFDAHFGIDFLALGRAFWQNLTQLRTVSGGSTVTMQVIRLSRKQKSRNIWEKCIEMFMAARMEITYSKKEILAQYASNAPFGGNVVGLDAAAWKYYGRPAEKLTWAEHAALAVLPNAPSLIHPGRNRDALRQKRDGLLDGLYREGLIDSMGCALSKLEPLPDAPKPLPMLAPHLLDRVMADPNVRHDAVVHTTLDANLQEQLTEIIVRHHHRLRENEIHNAAAIVADAQTGAVLAYIGNVPGCGKEHGEQVDIVPARRSSGSILKPFLYAGMLNDGELLPEMLMPDVPSQYGGYTPKNFDYSYTGATSARNALARSLNIPYVAMLNRYGVGKYHALLKKLGMSTLDHTANHYGLTLVLGGAETTLFDLAGMYGSMSRVLGSYRAQNSRYDPRAFHELFFLKEKTPKPSRPEQLEKGAPVLGAGAIWHTFEAMQEVVRPEAEGYWQRFASARQVAWKTGTSYGFRDAWAVGVTPRLVVAVWAGNADGEGRPGLMGVLAAAPILFDFYALIGRRNEWFDTPFDDLMPVATCHQSGYRAGPLCAQKDTVWVPKPCGKAAVCPFHQELFLDPTGAWRVHGECASPFEMLKRVYLVLPPAQEYYYRNFHPDFEAPPPFRKDCLEKSRALVGRSMDLIYPKSGTKIYVPRDISAQQGRTVFEAAHRRENAVIFWHIDNEYLGETTHFHQLALNPKNGKHKLTLVDDSGEILSVDFEILSRGY